MGLAQPPSPAVAKTSHDMHFHQVGVCSSKFTTGLFPRQHMIMLGLRMPQASSCAAAGVCTGASCAVCTGASCAEKRKPLADTACLHA
jgi:hypothetical protein